jgi:hypothetical protein
LIVLCFAPPAAAAETSANELFTLMDSSGGARQKAYEQVIQDEYYGMIWVNTYLAFQSDKKAGLWCPPPDEVLTGADLLAMMKAFVAGHPDYGKSPFGAVILFTVLDKFPCE